MGREYFEFRQFIVHQERCAMKVGTDGTLLGAWADLRAEEGRVLDIGTGTGLIALMMAQRFPKCRVVAIDIDEAACQQARQNVSTSPFANRIQVLQHDVTAYTDEAGGFDAIVSNPPFFQQSLECPDNQRTTARHATTLNYTQLMQSAWRLLRDDGLLSLIIPDDCRSRLDAEARLHGFFLTRLCAVRTTPRKNPKRYLMEFRKIPVAELDRQEGILEIQPNVRSPWYQSLTKDFYIK